MRELRPYQRECIAYLKQAWAAGIVRVPAVLSTGAGKTEIFTDPTLLDEFLDAGKRVLIIAHTYSRVLILAMREWWTDEVLIKRFEAKIGSKRAEQCWEWIGGKMPNGYGSFSIDRHTKYAHRLALARALRRDLAPGEMALHSCDNRGCVNPEHLRIGTHANNMQDKIDRDRFTRTPGESHGMHKLTDDAVRSIRERLANGERQRVLATEHGVSQALISFIKTRQNWKHI